MPRISFTVTGQVFSYKNSDLTFPFIDIPTEEWLTLISGHQILSSLNTAK